MSYVSREEENGITQGLLKELFTYKDGKLYWKEDKGNKTKAGSEAGTINDSGYIVITISGSLYKAHRLIFFINKGYFSEFIDHKDTIKLNNNIENLRECTKSQNEWNRKVRIDNNTGVKGLYYYWKKDKPWFVKLVYKGDVVLRKSFYEKENAVYALNEARTKYHKEFACND